MRSLDGEVDAFLILALSVSVAPSAGVWVLAIGAARYAFLAAGWPLAWMRAPLPRRDWRKVVAAMQGIVLTIAVADVLPPALTRAALAAALALLAESFGRDVWWLWRRRARTRRRRPAAIPRRTAARPAGASGPASPSCSRCSPSSSCGSPSSLPNQPSRLTPGAFVRLPLEGLVVDRAGPRPAREPAGASWPGWSGRRSACWSS